MRDFWDARREVRELRARMDQAFRLARQQPPCEAVRLTPPLDLALQDDGFSIVLDLPGVDRESLDVRVDHGALVISGEKCADESEQVRVLRQERSYGGFRRVIPLPEEADPSQVTARLKDGELRIKVGKQAAAGPRRIEVAAE